MADECRDLNCIYSKQNYGKKKVEHFHPSSWAEAEQYMVRGLLRDAEGDLIVHMEVSTNSAMPSPENMQVWYVTSYEADDRSYDEIVKGMQFRPGRRNYTSELERMRVLAGPGPTPEQVEQTINSILSHHLTEPR